MRSSLRGFTPAAGQSRIDFVIFIGRTINDITDLTNQMNLKVRHVKATKYRGMLPFFIASIPLPAPVIWHVSVVGVHEELHRHDWLCPRGYTDMDGCGQQI
jgi:hypothetical protein